MKRIVLVLLVAHALVARADGFKVGTTWRRFVPTGAYNWRAAKTHALVTQLWYPADAAAVEKPQWIGPPEAPLFSCGKAAPDAALTATRQRLPLVVLSHGTGGSAAMMAWLGTVLASHGYLVAAVNHPGNNGSEDYTVQGFTLWWERAHDLSTVIDQLLADGEFGPRIDRARIGAAGFSLGGFTMMLVAGAISDRTAYQEFCRSQRSDDMCRPPPEFPAKLMAQSDELAAHDKEYASSLLHEKESRRDPRVRAVFAIAPALGPAFRAPSLERIAIPVAIVAGAADDNVPVETSAKYFAAKIPGARLTILPGNVGHYVFLNECTERGARARPLLCRDGAGVDRATVHKQVAEMAARFFDAQLAATAR